MIARLWHGRTLVEKADEYENLMQTIAIPDYKATPGNQGVSLLKKADREQMHFLFFTLWESEEAIRRFAGEDIAIAKYYPFDDQFLLELEPTVTHYEVVDSSGF